MANTLLGAVSQGLGARRRTVKPCAEKASVRSCQSPGWMDTEKIMCIFPGNFHWDVFLKRTRSA